MRVLQIIDSLDAGGAERMAVNYANALGDKIEFSGIVVTRKEGVLKNQLSDKVFYSFLNKKKAIDFKSIKLLKRIVIQNDIEILHAHGTSFFTVFLLKLIYFKIKIVFHEHNGDRSNQSFFKNLPLFVCLFFFRKVLVVNKQIESWFHQKGIKKSSYFPNFASLESNDTEKTFLNGQEGKRIVCLANLREPKNHSVLIKAFTQLNLQEQGWSLHFVGKNYQDGYSENIVKLIKELNISDCVSLYDSKSDILNILSQATIGVLCSTYEGFPVTLLEYGLASLPVISSNVGFCSEVIIPNKTGLLFKSNEVDDLAFNLNKLVNDIGLRTILSTNLNTLVHNNYSKEKVVSSLVSIYKTIINEY
jgi:glycosyltransferase involved in cell wall biosynthesis